VQEMFAMGVRPS